MIHYFVLQAPPYHDEGNPQDLKAIEILEEHKAPDIYEAPVTVVSECVDAVQVVDDRPESTTGNVMKIPERQRKAASLQYHLPVQNIEYLSTPNYVVHDTQQVASCNMGTITTNESMTNALHESTSPSSMRENATTSFSNKKNVGETNDSTWDRVKKVLPGNIINSFSVPTSPTDVCSSNPFSDIIGPTFTQGQLT